MSILLVLLFGLLGVLGINPNDVKVVHLVMMNHLDVGFNHGETEQSSFDQLAVHDEY
jgi:hypothetical protein